VGAAPTHCGVRDLGGNSHLGKVWLYALVIAVVGVADLPFVARARVRRGTAVALLMHVGVLVVGWFVAFLVWAPFVAWE